MTDTVSTKEAKLVTEVAPQMSYRPKQIAQLLGISRETVYMLFDTKQLRGFRIGGARLVSAEELQRFIQERQAAEG